MARLNVGDRMPDFAFDTAYERGLTVNKVLPKAKRTVFWVLRYIGCTTCRYDVHILAQEYARFEKAGAQLFVVMQSQPENVRADLADNRLPFEIVCDPQMRIYDALEIYAAPSKEARMPTDPEQIKKLEEKKQRVKEAGFVHGKYEGNEQQLPALFVVEQDGVVSYAHYAKNSIDMPTPDEMLKWLEEKA